MALCAATVAIAQPKYVITDLGEIDPTTGTLPKAGPTIGARSPDRPRNIARRSQASAINDLGQVTGHSFSSSTGFAGRHAFRTAVGASTMTAADDLGTLGGPFSDGFDINASGQVVEFPGGPSGFSFALAIQRYRTGRGHLAVIPSQIHTFRTGPNSPIPPTDDLGALGGAYCTASAINNSA